MANTNDFWGRLGDALEGDAPECGCALSASPTSVDASLALNQVLARYATLAAQGAALQKIAAGKVQIPCEIWTAYANARQDYLTKAQDVFDQLTAQSVTIEQALYVAGKPKLDPSNRSRAATARLLAPLRPPSFTGLGQQCPGWVDMKGAYRFAGLGWERTPVQLASVPLSSLAAISSSVAAALVLVSPTETLLGIATPTAYQTLKKVAVLPRAFDADVLQPVTTYTACFLAQSNSDDAVKRCTPPSSMQAQAKRKRSIELWSLVGIGALVLVMGGFIARAFRRTQLAGDEAYSQPDDAIFLGDLYWRPRRGRGRRRLAGI